MSLSRWLNIKVQYFILLFVRTHTHVEWHSNYLHGYCYSLEFGKEMELLLDQRMLTLKTTHIEKPYKRLKVEWAQWQQKFLWFNGTIFQEPLKTVTLGVTKILIYKKQPLPVSNCPLCCAIWPMEMLLKTWNFLLGMLTAQQTDNSWTNIAYYCTQTIYAFKIEHLKSNLKWLTQHIVQTTDIKTRWSIIFCNSN
jgi:hypothetical protein